MIPYGKQDINQQDIQAVVNVLQSDFITQGTQIPVFEQSLANYCHASYAVAVNSATSALHIACLALGLGKGDYLWTSPITFVASANCALYCGAQVGFIDIDAQTYNLCAEQLEQKLIQAQKNNTLPKIVIAVHFAGQACEMQKIHVLSQQYGFKIIEDASHAIGGKYLDQPIGNCCYSDITVFSFHPVKIITTAEGGLAMTNQIELAQKMQRLRSHGITRDITLMDTEIQGDWYYQQIELGFNYRMTELQAALGISQMQRLDEFVIKRHQLQQRYHQLLADLPIILPYQSESSYSALHLYPIQLCLDKIKLTRKQVFEQLRAKGIGVNVHYIPVYQQPYYRQLNIAQDSCPIADSYYRQAISLPLFYSLTIEQQNNVIKVLIKILGM